jgi:hypothetical protein
MRLILDSEIHDKVVVCLNYYLGIRIKDEVFWELPSILHTKCQRQDILTMTTHLYLVMSSRKHWYLRRQVYCKIMYSSCTERKYTGVPIERTELFKRIS